MGREASKNILRRHLNCDIYNFFQGVGIDIGCGSDPYMPLHATFVDTWDKPQGDAQLMQGVESNVYDFVHSSHCLEHLKNPREALVNWVRILKPGGHLIVTVPDWYLYEHKEWPSRYNPDHKWAFTMDRKNMKVGTTHLLFVPGLVSDLPNVQVLRVQLNEENYNYDLTGVDQTQRGAQAEIEFILRKVK